MKYAGVDGCKAGWFFIALSDSDEWESGIVRSFGELWDLRRNEASIFVDIPIGLRDEGKKERLCDVEARRILKRPRASSVFPVPCRPAVYSANYDAANRINRQKTGRGITPLAWNICGKIREVDILMASDTRARKKVREVHPEVLFWALNNGTPMKHSKKQYEGREERIKVLLGYDKQNSAIIDTCMRQYRRNQVSKDDILDALAASVTAKYCVKRPGTFPEIPEIDSHGLRMEMVFYRPS